MQLRRLAALERQRIQDEHDELQVIIADLRDILADPSRVRTIIKDELGRRAHRLRGRAPQPPRPRRRRDDPRGPHPRRRGRHHALARRLREAHPGRRVPHAAAWRAWRARRGDEGGRPRREPPDVLDARHAAVLHQPGRVYRIKAYQVPEKQRSAKGVYVANVPGLALEADEQVATVLPLASFDPDRFLVFATAQGTVKRTSLDAFDSPRSVLIALKLNDGDELIGVTVTGR
jgi:DNA gyrase subunit A